MTTKEKSTAKIVVALCSFYMLASLTTVVSPALAAFAEMFPDSASMWVQQIMTLPNIVAVPVAVIAGIISGKQVKFRTMVLIACALIAIGGLMPMVFHQTLLIVLVARGIFGVGYGITFAIMGTLILRTFSGGFQAKVLGWAGASLAVAKVVTSLVAGWAADVNLTLLWLIYLLAALAFVFVLLWLPEPEKIEVEPKEVVKTVDGKKPRLSGFAIALIVMFGLTIVAYKPLWVGISTVVIGEGLGNATVAGAIVSVASVGQFFAGMCFAKFYEKFNTYALCVAMCVVAVGMILLMIGNLPIIFLGALIAGGGHGGFIMSSLYRSIDIIEDPAAVPAAGGLVGAFANFGGFLTPFWMSFLGFVVGNTDPRITFLAGAIFLVVLAILAAVIMKAATKRKKAREAAAVAATLE